MRDFTGDNSDYRWISNNATLTSSNWVPGQPDANDQRCVYVVFPNNNNFGAPGQWRDNVCEDDEHHAICETQRVSEDTRDAWKLVSFSPFLWRGWGGGSERGLGALSSPQKPRNSRWPDMHSEQSVSSWHVGFTANFAVKTSGGLK